MFTGLFSVPFLLIVVIVVLVLAGKSEDDPERERPTALYLSALTLLGVLLLLAGTYLTVNGLVELTDTKSTGGWSGYSVITADRFEPEPFLGNERGPRFRQGFDDSFRGGANHDDDVSQLIGGLIVSAIAVALIRFHLPRLQGLGDNSHGPGARVYSRLLYILSGITMLTGLAAAGSGIYAVYGMIAPDTARAGEVTDALRSLITAVAVTTVAAALFREAWTKAEDLAALGGPTTGLAAAPTEPPPPPVAPAKKANRARKAAPTEE